jgi:hypothetical protein
MNTIHVLFHFNIFRFFLLLQFLYLFYQDFMSRFCWAGPKLVTFLSWFQVGTTPLHTSSSVLITMLVLSYTQSYTHSRMEAMVDMQSILQYSIHKSHLKLKIPN